MQVGQLGAKLAQAHLTRRDPMTRGTAEFLESRRFVALIRSAICIRHLSDKIHRGEHGNASLKSLRPLLAPLREAELAVLPQCMATRATMRVEHVFCEFPLIFPGGNHLV